VVSPAGRRAAVLAYTVALLLVTLLPVPGLLTDALPSWTDKVVHFALFGSFAALLYWYYAPAAPAGRPGAVRVVGLAALLAALIEVAQGPLPERTLDPWDFVWGVLGAAVGYALMRAASVGDRTPET
jgi:VanZ family protein